MTEPTQEIDPPVDEATAADARRDRVRSAVECAVVIALALAIPVGLLIAAWRMAGSTGYGRVIVQMSAITLGVVAVGAGVATAVRAGATSAARRRAMASRGRCSRCGYDLSGLRAATCPECGSTTPAGVGAHEGMKP